MSFKYLCIIINKDKILYLDYDYLLLQIFLSINSLKVSPLKYPLLSIISQKISSLKHLLLLQDLPVPLLHLRPVF